MALLRPPPLSIHLRRHLLSSASYPKSSIPSSTTSFKPFVSSSASRDHHLLLSLSHTTPCAAYPRSDDSCSEPSRPVYDSIKRHSLFLLHFVTYAFVLAAFRASACAPPRIPAASLPSTISGVLSFQINNIDLIAVEILVLFELRVFMSSEAMVTEGFEDEELKVAFERWKSKSYELTVPLTVVALQGSIPPAWIKVSLPIILLADGNNLV